MGWLCDQVVKTGCFAVADFICPTPQTRAAFTARAGRRSIVWVDRIEKSDSRTPTGCSCRPRRSTCGSPPRARRTTGPSRSPRGAADIRSQEADRAVHWSLPAVPRRPQGADRRRPAPGRPGLHRGARHRRTDAKNPFGFEYVRARIEHGLREFEGSFLMVALPNVTHIFYGRDVGYVVERIELDRRSRRYRRPARARGWMPGKSGG